MFTKSYKFNSIAELLEFAEAKEINALYTTDREASSQRVCNSRCEWTGAASYAEAKHQALAGCPDIIKKMSNKIAKLESLHNAKITRFKKGVAGQFACVPAFINGNPNSMIRKSYQYQQAKIVNIVLNTTVCCDIDADKIINSCSILLEYIKQIEAAGQRCNIFTVVQIDDNRGAEYLQTITKVKDSGQAFDLAKLSFALCSPAFLRRIIFRIIEQGKYLPNYGQVNNRRPNIPGLANFIYLSVENLARYRTDEKISEAIKTAFNN